MNLDSQRNRAAICLLGMLIVVFARPLCAQTGCSAPPSLLNSQAPNFFSDQQEVDLGDAIAEQIQHDYRVSSDPELTAYLQRIGDRLLKYLPPNHLNFRFMLMDLSYPNAFSIAGGRIYISNKIIATARSEDELAGVLGHEFGHIVTHQSAIDMTRMMGTVLGVTAVSDRRDIFEKYHLLIENRRRKAQAFMRVRKRSLEQEEIADRVALYATARAGYSPQASVEILDRISGTEGKTGSWFSDLFGTGTDEARRLREMIKSSESSPEGCVKQSPSGSLAEFKKWQGAVISYSGWDHQEALHNVVAEVKLQPPLQGTLHNLKFSPDGQYVLAQDDATVFILSRDPLRPLLRVESPDSAPAQFTPDSKAVTVNSRHLRIETWDIAGAKRIGAYELVVPRGCLQSALAPDGKTLACLGENFDLIIFDVASGAEIDREQSFFKPDPFLYALFRLEVLLKPSDEPPIFVGMDFSPDAHYFLAAYQEATYAYDLTKRERLSLPHSIKSHLLLTFAFLGPDRLLAAGKSDAKRVPYFQFPSGEQLGEIELGTGRPGAAAHGDYVLVRPVHDFGVGVFDFKAGKYVAANKKPAFDVYDNLNLREQRDGEPAIYDMQSGKQLARVVLPSGSLGNLKVRAVSPDFQWLAVSGPDRGAVWKLGDGSRYYLTRAFSGAHFGGDGSLYVDFPKYEKVDRMVVRVSLNQRAMTPVATINDEFAQQYGPFLLVRKPEKHSTLPGLLGPVEIGLDKKVTWEIRDVLTGQSLWSRYFGDEVPSVYVAPREGKMVLAWKATAKAVHDEAQINPQVRQRLEGAKPDPYDDFLEVIDARNGNYLGSLLIDTGKGSFFINGASAAGDWVAATDNENRTLLYSLSVGEAKGRFFGTQPAIQSDAGLLALQNERGHLTLYDLSSMESVDEFVFPSALVYKAFAPDGKRLLVVTADQSAYTLDLRSETTR